MTITLDRWMEIVGEVHAAAEEAYRRRKMLEEAQEEYDEALDEWHQSFRRQASALRSIVESGWEHWG